MPENSNKINSTSKLLSFEVAMMAGKMSILLNKLFVNDKQLLGNAIEFLDSVYKKAITNADESENKSEQVLTQQHSIMERLRKEAAHPLQRLVSCLNLTELELGILILAGMTEEHEGFSEIFTTLHPKKEARVTTGLAAQLFCLTSSQRFEFRNVIEVGALFNNGILKLEGDGPFFTRNIVITAPLWSTLHGIDAWPTKIQPARLTPALNGLEEWLETTEVLKISQVIRDQLKCTVFITAENIDIAVNRAAALVQFINMQASCFCLPAEPSSEVEKLIFAHSIVRDIIPILYISQFKQSSESHLTQFNNYPGTVIVCAESGSNISLGDRTFLNLRVERLSARALKLMWQECIPELENQAALLAARYPVEPIQAQQITNDIKLTINNRRKAELLDVAEFISARSVTKINNSVQLIKPVANWDKLVLPESKLLQLQEAVNRLHLQATVLDEWRFLEGKRGARGVRMLFSGQPGTGKTLSAEIMAKSLDVDLLMIDISRVVSKWIGETEKNLAEVFDIAENTKAVLLFDEADTLFGKRTEISDAHDRYANLETAYLLSRLERYNGLAILSTNMQQNIDAAFTRRLEFIVEYQEPDREQRLNLWKCHLPDGVRLAPDVKLEELAAHFPIVGGVIKNAAVAAAFLAAAGNGIISKEHFIHAISREYEKSGKAYRSMPGGIMKTVSGGI